ncbi:hypothetical protein DFH11DRAFT_1725234 [Phellopilus nigrolimitatus]|nr:hypothetical protein DFH11DRAFT_1725234 [Phellopilus nigrolimitatus]
MSSSKQLSDRHVCAHFDSTVTCAICNKSFANPFTFKRHFETKGKNDECLEVVVRHFYGDAVITQNEDIKKATSKKDKKMRHDVFMNLFKVKISEEQAAGRIIVETFEEFFIDRTLAWWWPDELLFKPRPDGAKKEEKPENERRTKHQVLTKLCKPKTDLGKRKSPQRDDDDVEEGSSKGVKRRRK